MHRSYLCLLSKLKAARHTATSRLCLVCLLASVFSQLASFYILKAMYKLEIHAMTAVAYSLRVVSFQTTEPTEYPAYEALAEVACCHSMLGSRKKSSEIP